MRFYTRFLKCLTFCVDDDFNRGVSLHILLGVTSSRLLVSRPPRHSSTEVLLFFRTLFFRCRSSQRKPCFPFWSSQEVSFAWKTFMFFAYRARKVTRGDNLWKTWFFRPGATGATKKEKKNHYFLSFDRNEKEGCVFPWTFGLFREKRSRKRRIGNEEESQNSMNAKNGHLMKHESQGPSIFFSCPLILVVFLFWSLTRFVQKHKNFVVLKVLHLSHSLRTLCEVHSIGHHNDFFRTSLFFSSAISFYCPVRCHLWDKDCAIRIEEKGCKTPMKGME